VADLTNLQSLGITHCDLTHIPAAFADLVQLKHLDISSTAVTSDGLECLGDMSSLKELELSRCIKCMGLPDSLSRLTGLESLTLGRTMFLSLPDVVSKLPKLHALSWSPANKPFRIPLDLGGVWRLTGLQQLALVDESLTLLPPGISRLTGLTGLLVQGSLLTQLPASISALVGLERVGIYTLRLSTLPEAITALTKLTRIELLEDPKQPLPPAVAAFVQPRRWDRYKDDV
jgi:Leucine-rich repeat (LRR) protein